MTGISYPNFEMDETFYAVDSSECPLTGERFCIRLAQVMDQPSYDLVIAGLAINLQLNCVWPAAAVSSVPVFHPIVLG